MLDPTEAKVSAMQARLAHRRSAGGSLPQDSEHSALQRATPSRSTAADPERRVLSARHPLCAASCRFFLFYSQSFH